MKYYVLQPQIPAGKDEKVPPESSRARAYNFNVEKGFTFGQKRGILIMMGQKLFGTATITKTFEMTAQAD